jgi:putative heme-binding domain-containing protein
VGTSDGQIINGVLREETDTSITLVTKDGNELVVQKSNITQRKDDPPSLMPDNFGDLLSMKEFHDILSFLQGEQPEEPPE